MDKATITFHDAHIPVLEDGEYDVTVSQKLDSSFDADIADKKVTFNVTGPKFQLNPNQIVSVYPPNAGKGDFMAVLPTLALKRSTLPWERSPLSSSKDYSSVNQVQNSSWLFLLLVDENELLSGSVKELNDQSLSGLQNTLGIDSNEVHHLPKKINYLTVNSSLIAGDSSLIPNTLSELQYLSYARVKNEPGEESGEEHAVLLCNRLPKKGSNSTVYLVSLENNYQTLDNGNSFTFNGFDNPKDSTKKVFPYLYKWKFHAFDDQLYCITENKAKKINSSLSKDYDFSSIYEKVYIRTGEFTDALSKLKPAITVKKELNVIEQISKVPGSNFHELLSNLDGGFKPLSIPVTSESITSSGSLKLTYLNGTQSENTTPSNAWYRSPLAASPISLANLDSFKFEAGFFPEQASGLVLTINGTDDYTYSSAFELGRLTALDDVDFAKEFYKWKCEYAAAKRASLNPDPHSYLAVSDQTTIPVLPKHINDKFIAWKQLKGIPYRYLVPDPSLLPNESIRYFQVDQNWIKAFICGAFSIGHTIETNFSDELTKLMSFNRTQEIINNKTIEINFPKYGFLINSFAVSGWPGYLVETTPPSLYPTDPLKLVRRENLDVNIELFLYNNSFTELNFHLHPGKTHSGFLYENGKFTKESHTIIAEISPALTNDGENGPYVVDIKTLYSNIETAYNKSKKKTDPDYSISVFAGKMLEGTPEVYFNINPASKS